MAFKIYIGFSRAKSPFALFSHLIRLIDNKSPFSHVFIQWESTSLNRTLLYEARGNGVNFTNYPQFLKTAVICDLVELEVTDAQKTQLIQFCIDNCRSNYGYGQVLGIGLLKLARKMGCKSLKNPFKSGNICSELAAQVLEIIGKKIDMDYNLVTPSDIYRFLKE